MVRAYILETHWKYLTYTNKTQYFYNNVINE